MKTKNPKCRCFINAGHYAQQVKKGGGLRGYKPCPIHEPDLDPMNEAKTAEIQSDQLINNLDKVIY